MNVISLGIDTSNYTTSIALVDQEENIIYNKGILLEVKPGERGLRQSDALFQHVSNLPKLFKALPQGKEIKVICYSDRPRPLEESYMPVFNAGKSIAESLAGVLGIETLKVSHQENHIRAAIYGSGNPALEEKFLGVHFSGGTSEILMVQRKELGFDCEIIAKSLDLNPGQLIDRIGVLMGYSFPAGRKLEALAEKAIEKNVVIPSTMKGPDFHFSGQENQCKLLLKKGVSENEVAYGLLKAIGKTLVKSIKTLKKSYEFQSVLFSGGVMSNQFIKNQIQKELRGDKISLYFTPGIYARDNALGNSLLGLDFVKKGGGCLW